ncbi:MAG: NapC/NirT family cytochrome c [Bacteroidota bacterium]
MKLSRNYYNSISYLGSIIAFIATVTLLLFMIQIFIFNIDNVYFDLFTYIVIPGFLVLGLVLIPIGMLRRRSRIKRGIPGADDKVFVLNLRDKKTRKSLIIFGIITVFFVISTAIGSFKAFQYTESIEFCGQLCHKVMNPEYVAYQNSPHAKVKCAECHVGEGADFYVKSKMSGLRQVFKYSLNTYVRPIVTPIENLRPARETCEKCHWPQKFYTNALRHEKYFLADSANTQWDVILNMKIGASHQALGLAEGIHWHINKNFQIDYKSNAKRDTIFWVKILDKKSGKETIYKDPELKGKGEDLSKSESRIMDCMDCHNRPSHEFRSPSKYVNDVLAAQNDFAKIPWIKNAAMEALKDPYTTDEAAVSGIKSKIIKTYQEHYPTIYKLYGNKIASAIDAIIEAFGKNAFPEMKVTYSVYPRHIGHLESEGCFRCHNDRFKSPEGKVISKDCNLCHTIVAQGKADSINYIGINGALNFKHPVDIKSAWKVSNCSDCHSNLYQ